MLPQLNLLILSCFLKNNCFHIISYNHKPTLSHFHFFVHFTLSPSATLQRFNCLTDDRPLQLLWTWHTPNGKIPELCLSSPYLTTHNLCLSQAHPELIWLRIKTEWTEPTQTFMDVTPMIRWRQTRYAVYYRLSQRHHIRRFVVQDNHEHSPQHEAMWKTYLSDITPQPRRVIRTWAGD